MANPQIAAALKTLGREIEAAGVDVSASTAAPDLALIEKQYTLEGLSRALACAGLCPPLLEKINHLRSELGTAPRPIAAASRHPGTGSPTAPPQGRLWECDAFLMGMQMAGRITHPMYLQALDTRRAIEAELTLAGR